MEIDLATYSTPRAMELSRDDLLTTLAQLDEGVLICDRNGVIIFYNRLHAIIDGLTPSQVLGKHITEVYNLSPEESLSLRCIRSNRAVLQEFIVYKPRKGVVVNSINSVYPLRKDGKTIGCVSFLKDYKIIEHLVLPSVEDAHKTLSKGVNYTFEKICGASRELLQAITTARKAGRSDSPVMLYGETGTGKEMFAQSIHHSSHRKTNSYVAINCASIPENLFEGLLFGTRKGAFTGAVDQRGLFEKANGGTLFLDEIDSMPVSLQTKLLRALQEKKIRRVGDLEEIPVNIRVISSSSTPPKQFLADDTLFRKDLLYRLAVVLIKIPPLRERNGDIHLLTRHFLAHFNQKMGRSVKCVSQDVAALFSNYNWPGNVRELEHVVEGAMNILEHDTVMSLFHVAPYFKNISPLFLASQKKSPEEAPVCIPDDDVTADDDGEHDDTAKYHQTTKKTDTETHERKKIRRALMKTGGKMKHAAELLGISRQLLHYRMKKYRLDRKKIAARYERERLEAALKRCEGNMSRTAKDLGISLQLLNYKMKHFL